MKLTKKHLSLGILVVVLGIGVWYIAGLGPKGPDYSTRYSIVGREHIAFGVPHKAYNTDPPSSGPHYDTPSSSGFFHQEIDDETLLHNLEHGDIWIAYNPRITQEIKEKLRGMAATDDKLVIVPRTKNKDDISLVAWGRVDSFNIENNTLDFDRITNFILRYKNKGPERVTQPKGGN